MKRQMAAAVVIVALGTAAAAAAEVPGVYVILDGSGSMWGQLPDGTHKITAARDVVKRFAADDYAGRELAFRVYGHRREGDCSDSELVVPFSDPEAAISKMARFADGVNPKGKTPISRSLRLALQDFGDRPGEIILVSDGIETCDEDPCALVKQWRESNVAIRVHVVGLGLQDQERAAMECISEAAGTSYYDAQSADDLADGLAEIQQGAGEPGESTPSEWQVLSIRATTQGGDKIRVEGTAQPAAGGDPIAVTSLRHNLVPPGEHQVAVGVMTRNGNIYEPVTQSVTVAGDGQTEMSVVVPEPPSVRARFLDRGEQIHGSLVTAYQGGEEVWRFRPQDRAYLDPGTYEFRSSPNAENQLSTTETFAAGDHKEVVFELVQTVQALIKMVPAGDEKPFSSNYELWQDGELKYKVHSRNGVRALPGTYDLHLPLRLTPYVHPGLVLTTDEEQEFVIEVPVGHATIRYENADGSPGPESRIFVARKNEAGSWVRDGIFTAGDRIPLVQGEYKVEGWGQVGSFDEVFFEIAVGDEKELALRDKGN